MSSRRFTLGVRRVAERRPQLKDSSSSNDILTIKRLNVFFSFISKKGGISEAPIKRDSPLLVSRLEMFLLFLFQFSLFSYLFFLSLSTWEEKEEEEEENRLIITQNKLAWRGMAWREFYLCALPQKRRKELKSCEWGLIATNSAGQTK